MKSFIEHSARILVKEADFTHNIPASLRRVGIARSASILLRLTTCRLSNCNAIGRWKSQAYKRVGGCLPPARQALPPRIFSLKNEGKARKPRFTFCL